MKNGVRTTAILASCLLAGAAPQFFTRLAFAQTPSGPAVELQAAIATEQVRGDLDGAIAAYKKIAANAAAPRDVRAEALLHLAGCYEKKGEQALPVYQQIVHDFADQPPARQAAAKLASARHNGDAPDTISQRKVELAGYSLTFANTDGRKFVDRDPITQAFSIGDLSTGQGRVFFKPPVGFIDRGRDFPSKDMSMLFTIFALPGGKEINAVMKTDGAGYREISGSFYGRPAWSWDNRYVLQCEIQPDGTRRRVRISVSDGAVLPLPGPARCQQVFSPDGRYIASSEFTRTGSIFVGPTGGNEEKLSLPGDDLTSAMLMGWTRDGKYLAAIIDRSGTEGLYLIPMKDGKAAGDLALVRYGSFLTGQTFANGALVYESVPPAGQYATWLGELDSAGKIVHWEELRLRGDRQNTSAPAWSPDGKRIAYVTSNAAAGQTSQTVHLYDLATGEDRELYHAASGAMNCLWAARQPGLICGQHVPANNKTALTSIATESGSARAMGSVAGAHHLLKLTPDDDGIYMTASEGQLDRWDIAAEKIVSLLAPNRESRGTVGWARVSPDTRHVARLEKGQIEVREVAGGDWKPVVSIQDTQIVFSKDGNSILYHGLDSAGKHALMRVPVTGGQPERVGDFPAGSHVGLMWLSPDGRQIIADALNPFDTWVIENFEPKR